MSRGPSRSGLRPRVPGRSAAAVAIDVLGRRAHAERRVQRTGKARGPDRRVGPRRVVEPLGITFGARATPGSAVATSSMPRESRASARWRRSRISRSAPRSKPTDGQIITGCNIENSTYGLTMCAERVAIFKAAVRRTSLLHAHRRRRRHIAADVAVRRVPPDVVGVRRRHRSDPRRPRQASRRPTS